METQGNNTNKSGDCQAAAATETVPLHPQNVAKTNLTVKNTAKQPEKQNEKIDEQQQKVTAGNNNGNNNKLKQQQQQQQQQQQHQFRAPQQFVKHKKSTSSSALSNNNCNGKKSKTWNKRQHKNSAKQQQQQHFKQQQQQHLQQQQSNAANSVGSNAEIVCNLSSGQITGMMVLSTTKADLENSQNLKNQLSGIGSGGGGVATAGGGGVNNNHHHHQQQQQYNHHHYHAQHHHQHQHQIGVEGRTVGNGMLPAVGLLNTDKLGYGHGHMKQQQQQQQSHKKILTHRGHHHHVLCAAHNNNANVNGSTICCLVSNQNAKEAKDTVLNTSSNKCVTNVHHFCCARAKFFLPEKRPRKEIIIPPTKFLLGGNISDPLNLNSLQNETSASNNNTPATTPRRSPMATPPKVEVIIPPNIHDPLHLLDPVDSMEYEKQLTSPMKRGGGLRRGLLHSMPPHFNKHRHRKNRKPKRRRHESHNSSISTINVTGLPTSDDICSSNNSNITTGNSETILSNQLEKSNSTTMANVSSNSSTIDYSEERKENITDTYAVMATHLEHNEPNKAVLSPTNALVGETLSKATCVVSNTESQQIVGDMLLPIERLNRSDLRLDLHSASNSTCGSSFSGSRCSGSARKRRISESNSSIKNKKFYRLESMDKIVSPVVPQPGAWKRHTPLATGARKPAKRSTSTSETELLSPVDESMKSLPLAETLRIETPEVNKIENVPESGLGSPQSTTSGATSVAAGEQDSVVGEKEVSTTTEANESGTMAAPDASVTKTIVATFNKLPKFRSDGEKYSYGNYDRYAGFRHINGFMDVRLQVFQRYIELFQGKDILDIGCNVGHMTISVARNLAPKSILGIDIDLPLITQARRNLSLFVRIPPKPVNQLVNKETPSKELKCEEKEMKIKKTRRKKRGGKEKSQSSQLHHNNFHHHHHHHHHPHAHHHGVAFMPQGLFCCENIPDARTARIAANEFFPISFPLLYKGMPTATATIPTFTATKTPTNTETTTTTTTANSNNSNININTTNSNSNNNNNNNNNSNNNNVATRKTTNDFPRNVYFEQSNYVLKDESLLTNDTQQYDLILCLSVTKWIHLNFGDTGLKLAFKRIFNQLRPGGKLILEAQNWASYKKKKNLTENIYKNYRNIEFFPNKFHEYLLSSDVGFSHSYTLGVPRHMNKGFCRPLQLYAKGDYTPNHVRWSDAYYPQTPYEEYRGIYADVPPRPPGMGYPTSISSSRSHAYDTPHYTGASSGPYSCRQTPMHQPTSQYYNPLETDSYQPSYDMEYLNHMYVFASPLYQTVWSPPASLRKSSSHTPLFGSVRDPELDGECSGGGSGGYYPRHVYPPNEDTSSPNANMGGAFNSIHEVDTDDSNHPPGGGIRHVYATTHCGESSSSPQVNHHESEGNEAAIISDEDAVGSTNAAAYCDFSEH